jgi:hypothetical protein
LHYSILHGLNKKKPTENKPTSQGLVYSLWDQWIKLKRQGKCVLMQFFLDELTQ